MILSDSWVGAHAVNTTSSEVYDDKLSSQTCSDWVCRLNALARSANDLGVERSGFNSHAANEISMMHQSSQAAEIKSRKDYYIATNSCKCMIIQLRYRVSTSQNPGQILHKTS